MSLHQVEIGDSLESIIDFNDTIDPLPVFASGFPRADLYEGKWLISSQLGVQSATLPPGNYSAVFVIPQTIDMEGRDFKTLTLKWLVEDVAGRSWTVTEPVQVLPAQDREALQQDVVTDGSQPLVSVMLDLSLKPGDIANVHVFNGNTPVGGALAGTFNDLGESTRVDFNTSSLPDEEYIVSLAPYNVSVSGLAGGRPYVRYYRLYRVNPSIMGVMRQIEQLLHKSKIEQTIASLKYTEADLLMYMQRGLDMFNAYAPILTMFTGRNMQGAIQHGWVICTMIFALGAQVLAEGELAFDFSGQAVTLNVDRTPSLEAAIGRWEAMLESQVRPLKNLLAKAGIVGGDGELSGTSRGDALAVGVVGDHPSINFYRRGLGGLNNSRFIRRYGW